MGGEHVQGKSMSRWWESWEMPHKLYHRERGQSGNMTARGKILLNNGSGKT